MNKVRNFRDFISSSKSELKTKQNVLTSCKDNTTLHLASCSDIKKMNCPRFCKSSYFSFYDSSLIKKGHCYRYMVHIIFLKVGKQMRLVTTHMVASSWRLHPLSCGSMVV